MFVVKNGLDAAVLELCLSDFVAGEHIFGHLKLESLKNGLVIKVARKLDISHQLSHVD